MKKYQRDIRLKGYDYQTNGAYFLTICTDFKKKIIGRREKIILPRVIQAFKSLTTLKLKQNGFTGKAFWQRNYYEHVIRSEKTLEKIREYIQNNPLAEKLEPVEIYKNLQ